MKFTPSHSRPMQRLDQISSDLRELHNTTNSWRLTGDRYDLHPSMARLIANGYIPGNRIRKKLGLPEVSSVIPIDGSIPSGSLSLGARQCPNEKCGHQWFIPNTSRRRKCFLCSPCRSKRK